LAYAKFFGQNPAAKNEKKVFLKQKICFFLRDEVPEILDFYK